MNQRKSPRFRQTPVLAILSLFVGLNPCRAAEVAIVKAPSAATPERWAASELSKFLGEIYPGNSFPVNGSAPEKASFILLSSDPEHPLVKQHIPAKEIDEEGEFSIRHIRATGRGIGIIAGNSARSVRDGVYTLLEQKLGQGFYLHRNVAESAHAGSFDFQGWGLNARPMFEERVIFNWYNFLSGVTAWNPADYKHWIRQAARMRHTDVMLHAYGWAAFTEFTHNGVTKPVEYLQNSAVGRHWDLKHTKDVRKLIGGDSHPTQLEMAEHENQRPESNRC
jgi:hypothetical protein